MKKKGYLFIFIVLANTLQAQTVDQYSFKFQCIYGNILKHTEHLKNLVKGPVTGTEIAIEWQTMGEKSWHQYLNFPKVGVGTVFLDLGNPDTLGAVFAVYPYLNFPIIQSNHFNLNIKTGAGASYLNKTFRNATAYDTNGNIILNKSNAAIGSHINVYFAGSINLEIPVAKGISITSDIGWNHASNGSFIQPNSGINMINGFIGIKYFPNYNTYIPPVKQNLNEIPRKFTFEIIASGGVRQLYYKDNQFFPIGSIVLSAFRPITNFYRMGLGVDAFYDGVYDGKNSTSWQRTYIKTDEFKNKMRVGISWQHELLIGKITAGLHFGLYLYNPLKNLEPYVGNGILNKGLIYPYNIEKEDGWLYSRASLKYSVSKHYFLSLGLKTHLQKAEFIEWGLGYRF